MTHLPEDLSLALAAVADELRALSNAGLRFTDDPYQIERYHRIIELAAALTSRVNGHTTEDLRRLFFADMNYTTPYSVVDTAVFDEEGRILLIRRADSGRWALPGGACDVGETPATAAAREVWEETGCEAQIEALLGVFDARVTRDETMHHLYVLLFAGRVVGGAPQVTSETLDVRWFAPEDLPWATMHGSHARRIRHALRWRETPHLSPYFDPPAWTPAATWQHGAEKD